MNGGMKKWIRRWPKREELLRNWLQRRDRVTYVGYQSQRVVVKRAVKVAKKMADWRWRFIRCFEE